MSESTCYHCGLPVPRGADFPVVIAGRPRAMCCPGCQAVATAIVDGGLERFYDYRSADAVTPDTGTSAPLEHYDIPEVQADFARPAGDDGSLLADLTVSGITCSACAWLIEHQLARLAGIQEAAVNVSNHRCRVRWDPQKVRFSAILRALESIGYEARPVTDTDAEARRERENRTFLLRLGVAGLGMMQAGMVAVALYAGAYSDIDPHWRHLLRWVSLIIVTPVVFFSARPFFSAALTSLRVRKLVMDVPVALAIGLAYAASVWATFTNSGEVYFDSVSMFTFFLLLGRYLEMRVRHRNEQYSGSLGHLVPPVAVRLGAAGRQEPVPVKSLKREDRILVRGGETLPCDGEVVAGASEVVEAVLTGEQNPVSKCVGDTVSAGTVNLEQPMEIRVQATGPATRLAAILDLVADADALKPRRAALADRLAGWFVGAVLVIAAAVAIGWSLVDPARAFWVTLSVLVVTCPCALSLATPAALTVATGELRKRGFLIRKPHVLETLASLDHCIFDKTGTLTLGRMHIAAVQPASKDDRDEIIKLAAALESGSSHPIARAFRQVASPLPEVVAPRVHPGQGVSGWVDGRQLALGNPDLIRALFGHEAPLPADGPGLWLVLADVSGVRGRVGLTDELRPGATAAVRELAGAGVAVELLSGDREVSVARLADQLGVVRWRGGARPEDKLARARELQQAGHRIMMVGDGINDVPVLSGADVSVAMGDATDLTRLHADSLLVSGDLETLPRAVSLARRTARVIRQNLGWALLYNILALPLAALGFVPPWAAAIGMSASSLLVVTNALRLSSRDGEPQAPPV